MYVKDLFQKACDYLNIGFESKILNDSNSPYYNLAIIPQKYVIEDTATLISKRNLPFDAGTPNFFNLTPPFFNLIPGTNFVRNDDAYGYFDGTFGDLIRQLNDVFNAKIRIVINPSGKVILHFEIVDFYQPSTYQLPDVIGVPYATNASELAANYYIAFAQDNSDINTYNNSIGVNAQCMFTPIVQINQNNLLFKNLVQKNLSFARAIRKNNQTPIEILVQDFADTFITLLYTPIYDTVNVTCDVINFLLGWLGVHISNGMVAPSSLKVPSRINYMLLQTDFIGTQKLFIATKRQSNNDSNNITLISSIHNIDDNDQYLTAICLLVNFHSHSFILDTFHPTNPIPPYGQLNNQFIKYKNVNIPFCCEDYINILNNNYISHQSNIFPVGSPSWNIAKVEKIIWSPEKDEATMDYSPKFEWTKNIIQQYTDCGVNINSPQSDNVPIF